MKGMNKLLLVTLILCALAAWKTALSAEHYCVMTHCYYTSQDAGECAIDARWMGLAKQVATMPVTLERTDVKVTQIALAWLPAS